MIADPAKVTESLRVPNGDGVSVDQPQPVPDAQIYEKFSLSHNPRPLKIQLAMSLKPRMSRPIQRRMVDRPMMTKMIP